MTKPHVLVLAGCLVVAGGCQSFLDVNNNPNGPQSVSAILYLSPMLHWMVTSPQFDGRFVGRYTQQWTLPTLTSTPSNFITWASGSTTRVLRWKWAGGTEKPL